MLIEKINLWNDNEDVTLTAYILDNEHETRLKKRPTIIICPGGGFLYTSNREAEPIAMKFAGEGYNTFVLRYTTYFNSGKVDFNNLPDGNRQAKYPQPLFDLARAILTVRENADKWAVDNNKIFVCGFSAGGYLAASLGVHWQDELLKEKFNVNSDLFKPNGMILGYPLLDNILMKELLLEVNDKSLEQYWRLSCYSLSGESEPSDEYLKKLSPVNHVCQNTPPTFMWHTANDELVSVRNSINFATELSKNKIPYELHIFEAGSHGLALCNEVTAKDETQIKPEVQVWFDMALTWLKAQVKK
ncbi:acetyl esterase/lipase [Clostridium saccharoperbutylacetonicum]|uniref:Esterase/lipase n=1 Tax=Clostridium saccharoperbutylacetonicum N1-4(HMT) TaxID=931276 RepID=M1MLJ5_9CLOT|nr:alpha/beta hydrolase [Clostridium saccharoperbutylacetonicum]AGF55656.1 esterase/lipase [Clostridium saccharoperbutylacetonicum N1-4(HMT)]NRT63619.1 acetyl esterase/lipase [Clostridium saccharoperbutylacetonicum]NSB26982.1 acetyl esterase/lipase [Clostridium saccharoperbutylacetonicum]NSB40466.1 acetyl esterase/lipase [Clostridium saccharoperbutylacetonicum]